MLLIKQLDFPSAQGLGWRSAVYGINQGTARSLTVQSMVTWRAVCFLTTLMSQELASKPPPGINSGGGLLVSGIVIETREESFMHTIARTANGARVWINLSLCFSLAIIFLHKRGRIKALGQACHEKWNSVFQDTHDQRKCADWFVWSSFKFLIAGEVLLKNFAGN